MIKKRILLVDDNRINNKLVASILRTEACGYDVICLDSGKKAISVVQSEVFDVVITDLYMPEVHGFDVLEYICNNYPSLPVIILTADSSQSTQAKAMNLGAYKFLTKPLLPDLLLSSLEECFNDFSDPVVSFRGIKDNTSGDNTREVINMKCEDDRSAICPVERTDSRSVLEFDHIYPYLVGGLIHDLKNTVFALQMRTSLLRSIAEGDTQISEIQKISSGLNMHLEHFNRVLTMLQGISRAYYADDIISVEKSVVVLSEYVTCLKERYQNVRFFVHMPPELENVKLPKGVISFIASELLANASKACFESGAGDVKIYANVLDNDSTLELVCVNTGTGFSHSMLEKLVHGEIRLPTKAGVGGYGLYLINEVVSRLQGRLLFSNIEPEGASVQVLLPTNGLKNESL